MTSDQGREMFGHAKFTENTPGDSTPADGSSAQVIDCSQALGFPAKGIAVTTPPVRSSSTVTPTII